MPQKVLLDRTRPRPKAADGRYRVPCRVEAAPGSDELVDAELWLTADDARSIAAVAADPTPEAGDIADQVITTWLGRADVNAHDQVAEALADGKLDAHTLRRMLVDVAILAGHP